MPVQTALEYLPKQGEFFANCDRVPFSSYIGGFGSGKTHCLVLQILREATRPDRPPCYGLVGAPTYILLRDTTERKFFELCPTSWIRTWNKTNSHLQLVNGSELIFRSLDSPERLTNLGLDWFALDEIGEVKEETFRMLQGRLRRPGGRHVGFGVGNPAGRTHWTYHYFVELALEHPEEYALVQATSYENTFLPEYYTKRMTTSYGEGTMYHKRFVLGMFVAFEGSYWPNFDTEYWPKGHKLAMADLFKVMPKDSIVRWGKTIDFGFEHPFVCLWWVTDGSKIVFFDEHYERHSSLRAHCWAILKKELEHQKTFGPHEVKVCYRDHDAQDGHEIENMKSEDGSKYIGFPSVPAEKKVFESILLVQTLIEEDRILITDRCKHALVEVPSYRAKPSSISYSDSIAPIRGGTLKEEPIKEKDDAVDCIRMTCQEEMAHMAPWSRTKGVEYLQAAEKIKSTPAPKGSEELRYDFDVIEDERTFAEALET